jgi:hypothetical protein
LISIEDIKDQLIQSDNPILPDNFVAAAVRLSVNGEAVHAGFVIQYNNNSYLVHYYGEVLIENVPNGEWYFHKDLIFIGDLLTGSFFTHCQLIRENANPAYALYYDGSFYKSGKYFSGVVATEYMSCVGFCLSVLKGFIGEEYLNYSDWGIDTIESEDHKKYLARFITQLKENYPSAEVDLALENARRISPDEYLASAYFDEFPIKRAQIDTIIQQLRAYLISKLN